MLMQKPERYIYMHVCLKQFHGLLFYKSVCNNCSVFSCMQKGLLFQQFKTEQEKSCLYWFQNLIPYFKEYQSSMSSRWVNPGGHLSHSLTSPREAGDNQKGKSEKWCYKDSLIGKAKAAHVNKAKQGYIHYFPAPGNFSPCFFIWNMMLYGLEYPVAHWGSPVLALCPPKFLCTPSLLAIGEALEKTLNFSAIAKTFVFYQHPFGHKSKRKHHTNYCEEI